MFVAGLALLASPPRIRQETPTEIRHLSVDVECVATGLGHNDRAPCRIAAVDEAEAVLLDVIIRVPGDIVSTLEPITGLNETAIQGGVDFEDALAQLRPFLGPYVVLVGQSISHDIFWLGLERGVDYAYEIDLAECFRTWNDRYKAWNYFSLRKTAWGLLGVEFEEASFHDPKQDALLSIQLFNKFVKPGLHRQGAKTLTRLLYSRQFPTFLKRNVTHIDGVCGSAYPGECICGQPPISEYMRAMGAKAATTETIVEATAPPRAEAAVAETKAARA